MSVTNYFITVKRIGLLVLLYFVCRILFFIFNQKAFVTADTINLTLAFIHGLRFDLAIIFASNLLFIVLSILPISNQNNRVWYLLLKILFLLVNLPLLLMNLADIEYYKFTSKRTGYDVIGIIGDVKSQSLQLAVHYWYLPLIAGIFIFIMIKFYGKHVISENKKIKLVYSWALLPVVILFSILIIRGGFQYKPLKPDHAFVLTPNVLGNLVLNTPYNFFSTLSFPRIENVSFYKSDEEAIEIIKQKQSLPSTSDKKVNVVIIIMESFAREYMSTGNKMPGFTPFLDSLAGQAVFFDHHFANGKKSVEAVPSIFASIPSLMEEPYITGVYQGNEIHGLAELLGKNGYQTAFFHGGRNGTMGFDKFTINAGFQKYYGLDEYPDKDKDYDGNWGIYDEPYLNYFCKTISGFKKPFMASVFTLSSHQPYSVPEKYKGKFPKGFMEIHESVGYADYALKKFFECAAKQDWYNNTLFVITADHTQSLFTPKYSSTIGEYRVPLILFQPGKKIIADTSQVSQHLDIMPTVLKYTGVENKNSILFGQSLLDSLDGRAIYYTNKTYIYVKKDYFLEYQNNKFKMFHANDWKRKKEINDQPVVKNQYEKELKAYIQYYNNGLNNNNWYR
jgi:phosphoglycerol transferase MdoB-like AlkP superfamily enzyme